MNRFTLRQKFLFGMVAVLAVSLLVMLGGRYLAKGARFHHLERDHLATVMQMTLAMQRAASDLMGEISAASSEQSAGVSQVGEAVTQMDQVTQQNAALVEEMAAAASSLKSQAQELVQTVSVFKLTPAGTASILT